MRGTLIRSLSAAVCGLMLTLLVSSVFAQGPPRGPGGMRGGMRMIGPMGGGMRGGMGGGLGVIGLLGIEQVQKEIQLTDDQKTQIQKIRDTMWEEARKRMAEFRDLSPEEARKRFEADREKLEKEIAQRDQETLTKLSEILKSEQLKRARQIQMQQAGAMVLRWPMVVEELALSEDQKAQLKKIADDTMAQMRQNWQQRRPEGGPPPDRDHGEADGERDRGRRDQMQEQMRKMREEIEKKCMAVLTAEQKTKLAEMMGEPFELDRSAMRGAWGQGGRRGEGRRGEGRGRGRPRRGGEGQPEQP